MKKSVLEVYALAVCFASIVCFAVALGIAIYDGVLSIIYPDFTINSQVYSQHQSNDAYWNINKFRYMDKDKNYNRLPDDQLTKERMESYQIALSSERRNGLQNLTICVIITYIPHLEKGDLSNFRFHIMVINQPISYS